MIRSFRNKGLAVYYTTGRNSSLNVPNVTRVGRVLRVLAAAGRPDDANLPGFHFHALHGAERWSIRVTGNWRITCGWDGADAVDVDLEDYH